MNLGNERVCLKKLLRKTKSKYIQQRQYLENCQCELDKAKTAMQISSLENQIEIAKYCVMRYANEILAIKAELRKMGDRGMIQIDL